MHLKRRPYTNGYKKKTLRKLSSATKREVRFLCQFGATLKTYFPRWQDWLADIQDPRVPGKCSYTLSDLLWMSLLMLLAGLGSRNQFNENICSEETQLLLQKTLGLTLPSLPHGDTLAYLWKKLPPDALEKLRTTMVRTLLHSRRLERFRYRKQFYILAIDGTELYRWKERHCENCLHAAQGKDKELQYFHRVLELKLISHDGLALSVLTEFIENTDSDAARQDCEIKAAYRLLRRLKALYPKLPILLLADGIYPSLGCWRRRSLYSQGQQRAKAPFSGYARTRAGSTCLC
ncbi:MAG: transposase family protein, partial [Candidatus Sericytochromatia bacterium]|nr:transposase family protein [Candidatus Sericytochromatia bacterium]